MAAPFQPTTRLRDTRPEPSNLWIRHTAVWPAPDDVVWVDPARGTLGGVLEGRSGAGRQFAAPEDVVYLPPGGDPEERRLLMTWCAEREVPFYLHQVAGVESAPSEIVGATVLVDPLAALIEGRLGDLDKAVQGATAIWPTLSHLTDGPALLAEGLDRLRAAGVSRVVPVVLSLTPAAGRRLTERFGDKVFDAVFHAGEVDIRPVAQACRQHDLDFLSVRPPLGGADAFGRRVAAELAQIGELWVASGESPAGAQEFFRASSWVETSRFDLRALVRDDNLAIVPSLSGRTGEVIRELAAGAARSARLTALVERFSSPAS